MKTYINGEALAFEPRFDETALEVIRERAGLTGTKEACGGGICGACTVLVEGTPTCSCLMPATHMADRHIQTIEAHGPDNLHPVQLAFMANEGLQCGFCSPGFINEGIAFYERWRTKYGKSTPSREEVALAMGGHLCRCAAYVGIYAAIQQACAGKFDAVTELVSPRVDALAKVTGQAKYTVDTVFNPNQLEGKILRSPHPHALIKSIDTQAALALEGVMTVANFMEGRKRVRYVGQPILGVAAVDGPTAVEALKRIKIDYEVLPATIGLEQALQADSSQVYPDGRKDTPTAAEGTSFPYTWQNNVGHLPLTLLSSKRPRKAQRKIDTAQAKESANVTTTDLSQRPTNAYRFRTPMPPWQSGRGRTPCG